MALDEPARVDARPRDAGSVSRRERATMLSAKSPRLRVQGDTRAFRGRDSGEGPGGHRTRAAVVVDGDKNKFSRGHFDPIPLALAEHPDLDVKSDRGLAHPLHIGVAADGVAGLEGAVMKTVGR